MKFMVDNFLGINNVDDALRRTKVEFSKDGETAILSGDLKSCINFRIYKDRIAKTRNGQTPKLTLTDGHDLWVNKAGNIGLFVDGITLKKFNADYTATQKYTGLTSKARMTFAEHEINKPEKVGIYMGNGHQMLKYNPVIDTVSTWGDTLTDTRWEEFESPRLTYCTPPLSNIVLSYRTRMYAADGRFLLYSKEGYPETFRRSWNIPVYEDITALSWDYGHVYIHTFNTTTVLTGLDPDDFVMSDFPIGAIKHGSINPLHHPYILGRYGWAICREGIVEYIGKENFELDLETNAEAYMWYDPIKKEIGATILQ